MKKKFITILLIFCALSLSGCTESGTSDDAVVDTESDTTLANTESDVIVEDTESVQLAQDYTFYTESVSKLENDMNLDPSQANAVFKALLEVGLNEEISYCFDEDGFYKVWWGLNSVDVYLSEGLVEKIMDGDKQLYPSAEAPTVSAEPNTTARLEEILALALYDAENTSEDEAIDKINEALAYLKAHQTNFYESNDVMERAMYYGNFICEYIEHNSVAANVSELPDDLRAIYEAGWNTLKAIKYVYRGVESELDQVTQDNLKEAQSYLDLISVDAPLSVDETESSETEDSEQQANPQAASEISDAAPSPTQEQSTPVQEQAPVQEQTPQQPPAQDSQSGTLVWVDDSAAKYHKKNGCGMDNAYQVSLDQAVSMGKEPCGRCY